MRREYEEVELEGTFVILEEDELLLLDLELDAIELDRG